MRRALVVGINNYPTAPLNGCINDAVAVKSILEVNGDGSPNFDVKEIHDVSSKSELIELIEELFAGDVETALFYFSGHGFLDDFGGGIIVTPDFKPKDEGVSMETLLKYANASKAKNKVIVLDCCHAGALGSFTGTGSTNAQIGEGVSILTASKADEVSMEVNGHGVFTNLFIEALRGGAADLRGHITPGGIYSFVDQALGAWDQRPVFKTNISKFTSLRTVNAQVSIEVLRRIPQYFKNAGDYLQLDPSFEFTNDPSIVHEYVKPYANESNVITFKELQKMASAGLIIPVEEEHMYFAAMNSKSCRLTALGYHYWRLAKERRI